MNALVAYLSQGDHPVMLGGPAPVIADLPKRITEVGYLFIKFLDTSGGTDVGVRVDTAATNVSSADFAHATGTAHIEGTLTLNFVPVRCVADLDLATAHGTGHLIVMQTAQA